MDIAQRISSMILSLRRKEKLKVRQPLAKIIVPVLNDNFRKQFEAVESIILSEVNVKEVEYLTDSEGIIKKNQTQFFKTLTQIWQTDETDCRICYTDESARHCHFRA